MFGQYNQMYNPMQYQNVFGSLFAQPHKITRVKGREGALAINMMPGSEDLFLDLDDPIIWLVQTDDAGIKTVDALDVFPHKSEEQKAQETLESIEERLRKLEEAMTRESRAVDVAFTEE